MNKGLLLSIFLIVIGAFAIANVSASPLTVVTGLVTYTNSSPVVGANVHVVCQHSNVNYTQDVSTNALGNYYAFYNTMQCDNGDHVWVTATLGEASGHSEGVVEFGKCLINTAIINITIPEFGVVAGSIALLGAVGVVLYKRKK